MQAQDGFIAVETIFSASADWGDFGIIDGKLAFYFRSGTGRHLTKLELDEYLPHTTLLVDKSEANICNSRLTRPEALYFNGKAIAHLSGTSVSNRQVPPILELWKPNHVCSMSFKDAGFAKKNQITSFVGDTILFQRREPLLSDKEHFEPNGEVYLLDSRFAYRWPKESNDFDSDNFISEKLVRLEWDGITQWNFSLPFLDGASYKIIAQSSLSANELFVFSLQGEQLARKKFEQGIKSVHQLKSSSLLLEFDAHKNDESCKAKLSIVNGNLDEYYVFESPFLHGGLIKQTFCSNSGTLLGCLVSGQGLFFLDTITQKVWLHEEPVTSCILNSEVSALITNLQNNVIFEQKLLNDGTFEINPYKLLPTYEVRTMRTTVDKVGPYLISSQQFGFNINFKWQVFV